MMRLFFFLALTVGCVVVPPLLDSAYPDRAGPRPGRHAALANSAPVSEFWAENPKLVALFKPDSLTRNHRLEFETHLSYDTVLNDGEAYPPTALRELYALARAPMMLIPVCDEMLAAGLARKCDVFHPRIQMHEDGDVTLRGTLRFLPAYTLGNPETVKYGDLHEVHGSLTRGLNIADTPEGRQEVMSIALQTCAELRARIGNCVISSMGFDRPRRPRQANGGDTLEIDAYARFQVFADRREYRAGSAKALVQEILDGLKPAE